mgnify:FL=1
MNLTEFLRHVDAGLPVRAGTDDAPEPHEDAPGV